MRRIIILAALLLLTHAATAAEGWGIDLTDRDASVKPGDDFYRSQNGAWMDRTELKSRAAASYWGDLRRLAPQQLAAILDEDQGRAGAFYRSFLNEAAVEVRGLTPLEPELAAIRSAKTKSQLAAEMGSAAGPGMQQKLKMLGPTPDRGIFVVSIGQDQQSPGRYAVYLGQGGLGLPGPEYYLDPQLADIKAAYEAYAAKILSLIGWPDAERRAKEIVDLESRIAQVSWSDEQLLDSVKTYNRMSVAELSALAPGFDWRAFLRGAELESVRSVVVDAKSAFPKIAAIYAATPLDVLQARQAFIVADDAAPLLSSAAVGANFDFHGKIFRARSAVLPPRKTRALTVMETTVGDLLGSLYVARCFSPEAKAAAVEMAERMRHALDARLEHASWLSEKGRAAAREKVARMRMNIGYPDVFEDYRTLKIAEDDLYGNVRRATAYNWRRQVRRLGEPYDRREWLNTSQSVNYAYVPATNTVEIPAATLQPPFFDPKADAAVNYGAIGTLIGAQLMGAFDNHGRHHDAAGRLREWLTAEESARIEATIKAIADQYTSVEPLPGIHIQGELVADEAFQDMGGTILALDAYHASLGGHPAPPLDGFTGDQRFFLGRVQMWRAKFDDQFVRNQVAQGHNAPPFLRVNGPVRTIDAWYEAFQVRPGDRMYLPPGSRVHIW